MLEVGLNVRRSMKQAVILVVSLLVMVAAVPGCKRSIVKDEKTFELQPTIPHILYIPATKKCEINFTTKDNALVSAYLVSKADGEEAEKASTLKGKPMATQDNVPSGRLVSPTSEAKVELAAVFISKTRASVTAKISGE
jgi:hypothetical protein